MAKGQKLKQEIAQKILDTFPNSFLYNDGKEIRIEGTEDSDIIQIKVTLTAAKINVEPGGENAVPGIDASSDVAAASDIANTVVTTEPSEQEKDNLRKLLQSLNL